MTTVIILFFVAVIVVAVILVAWFFLTYNELVSLKNQVKNAWSQIDVQLKRRHDLIPNLMESVKGYAKHEKETFDAITRARAAAVQASGIQAQAKAEGELSGVLQRLMAVVEAYPELKANQNFMMLQEELSSTENRIAFSRQAYNDQVLQYNNKIQMVPSNIVANLGHFSAMELFELKEEIQRQVPDVKF